MAIVEMTKAQVIAVLRKEKLTHSVFAAGPDGLQGNPRVRANEPGCTFCAVGQVVRHAMAAATPLSWVFDQAVHAKESQVTLRQLEAAFEFGWETGAADDEYDDDGKRGRKCAIAHVRKHFPARVRIDIGNAKPRRGMRVVG